MHSLSKLHRLSTQKVKIVMVALMLLGLSGCAVVQPWEREYLADPIMQFDICKEEKAVKEHFISTREGSSGSFGVSGGGCGCN